MDLATIERVRRGGRPQAIGFPERLRSALTARGWVRRSEPRVRFGQPVFPGVTAIGPGHRPAAASFLAQAEVVRGGVLAHLGRACRFGDAIDWFPPETTPTWQQTLHGLDELLALGVAAATSAAPDERRAWYDLARRLVIDWTRRVPPGHPVAWSLPPLAARVRNLLLFQALVARELRDDAGTRRTLLSTVYAQAAALAAAVPRHTPDAWLIAAGTSLVLAGRFFDGMEARGWVEAGTALLWGQLREQVNEDGGHVSRSPVWQAFVLAEYLAVLAMLRADNDDVPLWGRKRVKGMADFLARLAHPDGTVPQFGPAPACRPRPVSELLATAAVVLHEPAFALASELPGVWPFLLVGDSGRRVYASLGRSAVEPAPRSLRRTGYHVLAGGSGDVMVVDGGEQRCADGTATFGYELSVGGLALVVGTRVRTEEPGAVAEHARTRSARNVLVTTASDSQGEPRIDGRFTIRDGVQYFLGTAQGFAGRPNLQYQRRVFCLPGRFWLVCDELHGSGSFGGESFVHLHPGVSVRAHCAGRPALTVRRGQAPPVGFVVTGVRSLGLAGGATKPRPQGWYATRDGVWDVAPVVVLRAMGMLPLTLAYAFVPGVEGADAELTVASDAFELRARLRIGEVVHELTAVQDELEFASRPETPSRGGKG